MSEIRWPAERETGFRLAVAVEGALGVAAVALAAWCGVPLREQFAPTPLRALVGIAVGFVATLPLLVCLLWMIHTRWPPLANLRELVREMVRQLFPAARLADLALIATLAGVGEELLFRGFLQTWLTGWLGPTAAWGIASLVFGALHSLSWVYFMLAALIGGYLGWLLFAFGDLAVPILVHAIYDFVAIVYFARMHRTTEPD